MSDIRTFTKNAFLDLLSPLIHRSLIRWIPGCPLTRAEWLHAKISYSQFGEDLLVEKILRAHNVNLESVYYVDIGCWNPVKCSNSFLFYRRGGQGIVVDPNPEVLKDFSIIRPRDLVVQAAISSTNGKADYCSYEWSEANSLTTSTGGGSGISLLGQSPETVHSVHTLTLESLLIEHVPLGRSIELLDVDCEGHDLQVLKSNDWSRFRPRVILVEAHGTDNQTETQQYLAQFGYQLNAVIVSTMVFYVA